MGNNLTNIILSIVFGFSNIFASEAKIVAKTANLADLNIKKSNINILMKNGDVIDITSASDQFNIEALNKTVNKYFLCLKG